MGGGGGRGGEEGDHAVNLAGYIRAISVTVPSESRRDEEEGGVAAWVLIVQER